MNSLLTEGPPEFHTSDTYLRPRICRCVMFTSCTVSLLCTVHLAEMKCKNCPIVKCSRVFRCIECMPFLNISPH